MVHLTDFVETSSLQAVPGKAESVFPTPTPDIRVLSPHCTTVI